jgi:excisionase family DNA binding protein
VSGRITFTLTIGGQPLIAELDDAALAEIANAISGRTGTDANGAPSPWLTVRDAARYLGLSEHATRKLLDRHAIPRHQLVPGGRILLRRTDLDAYLDAGRTR